MSRAGSKIGNNELDAAARVLSSEGFPVALVGCSIDDMLTGGALPPGSRSTAYRAWGSNSGFTHAVLARAVTADMYNLAGIKDNVYELVLGARGDRGELIHGMGRILTNATNHQTVTRIEQAVLSVDPTEPEAPNLKELLRLERLNYLNLVTATQHDIHETVLGEQITNPEHYTVSTTSLARGFGLYPFGGDPPERLSVIDNAFAALANQYTVR